MGCWKRGRSREVPPDEHDRVEACDERSWATTPRDVTSTLGQTRRGRSAARGRTSPDRKTSPAAPRRDSGGCVTDVKGNIQADGSRDPGCWKVTLVQHGRRQVTFIIPQQDTQLQPAAPQRRRLPPALRHAILTVVRG